ncbi:MAG: RNA-binding S4 domain-containing protein [Bacteroidetes bacterium]|nr:MAG: RNA-binding S4 domain-containing protein [Bacteroidota bacterium]RLD86933.1 MAG: RNA-binding S4 domain-containing protein [Bacteroidota bacterium]HHL57342.1 RNA-binding S4 domain-containing protein [Bacteroidota bacterium]
MRIDKWLWAVRLFKTRTQASDACKGGKIKIAGQNAKPSREIKKGDEIEVQLAAIRKKVRVKELLKNRVAAKLVDDYLEDLTSPEEYEKLEMMKQLNYERRERGKGRPTKKERRTITKLKDNK